MEYKKVETGDIGAGAQAVIGIDQSNISQYQGISGKDLEEVQNLFAGLRTELEKQDVPEVTKEMGKEFVNQIEEEVTKKDAPPDGSVIKVAGNWLLKNIPSIAGTLANVFINPIVGKVVQAAGEIATKWVQEKFSPAEKGA